MRSPDNSTRVAAERAAHIAACVLVAFALWRSLQPAVSGATVRVDAAGIAAELPNVLLTAPKNVHLNLSATPTSAERDALRAVAHTGTQVTWSGDSLKPLALAGERIREPGGPVRITVAGSAPVELSDALAVLDTVVPGVAGTTVIAAEPSGMLRAKGGRVTAGAEVGAPPSLHSVLVLGRASFEGKFVVAALEERGWTVDARLVVAPGAAVTTGKVTALDTSRYSAVVALDTTLGAAGPQIARFVRDGGGLVLLGDAANAAAVQPIAPARIGARTPSKTRDVLAATPLDGLPLQALESLRADAVRLGARGDKIALAARREDAGRVLQIGYDETWRWRMQGGDDAVVAHRVWWSRLVASVAYAGDASPGNSAEGAPLARLYDAFGAPSAAPAGSAPAGGLPAWLLPLIGILLLAEWGSRRLRGAK